MKLIDVNNILAGLVGDVELRESIFTGTKTKDTFVYLHCYSNGKDDHELNEYTSIDELIKAAWKLKRPLWTKVEMICTDIINKEVWLDKITPVTVERINITGNGTKIISTSGRTYSSDNIWLKL